MEEEVTDRPADALIKGGAHHTVTFHEALPHVAAGGAGGQSKPMGASHDAGPTSHYSDFLR
ncbi:hypothetical protein A605_05335 [Corynebacterium halotolerans YIM 70093 = DSM 44683]|uniref:Uncharacterized protein n=1 Tax=Corynebacterium halotolerans YIM 70093 = DSM 44683 TaxID=1121362 RepID=M1NL07_9CORY|nr:hypothetical protein A605_05335 [Corynebacterium halotolerans YIM 70093 = DSM 44683]